MSPHTTALALDFGTSGQNAADKTVDFAVNLVAFLAILIVGWLVAKALSKVVDTVLERVGFDHAVERGGIKQALARSRYDASDLVAKLVYYAILLITLVVAFNVFGPNPVSDLLQQVVEFLPRLIVAIILVVIVAAIASAVRDIVTNVLSGTPYGRILGNVVSLFILGLGIVAALEQVGIGGSVPSTVLIAVLATVAGVVVVGVGGGLVMPMAGVWQRWIERLQSEAGNVRTGGASSSTTATGSSAPTAPSTGTTTQRIDPAG